ncbi:hypothetical protein K3757_07805 [Sulfitobacter sp. S223]|uniref:hypothetical protein n=1 Tax=Sulfitobacter sp. S223 TaxID=2867023 RepID=UPI0021A454F9|nr:hypothetical protein [Sulfitobacter sp. S223]UWR27828.1 hypothetical protein K3757_07805 [Sulfitobacter sp. S223]
MNTPILVGICAALSLGAAEASADQQVISPSSSVDNNTPTSISCAQERGAPLGKCSYRIKRDENGQTTVTVVFANGFKRGLFFMDGRFLKASVTMSGVGTDTDWSLKDGTHIIRVDGQRYEVPDILIAGD